MGMSCEHKINILENKVKSEGPGIIPISNIYFFIKNGPGYQVEKKSCATMGNTRTSEVSIGCVFRITERVFLYTALPWRRAHNTLLFIPWYLWIFASISFVFVFWCLGVNLLGQSWDLRLQVVAQFFGMPLWCFLLKKEYKGGNHGTGKKLRGVLRLQP